MFSTRAPSCRAIPAILQAVVPVAVPAPPRSFTHVTSVTATSATSNMSSFPTGNALYPDYLRTATTKGTYSCSTTGLVAQASVLPETRP